MAFNRHRFHKALFLVLFISLANCSGQNIENYEVGNISNSNFCINKSELYPGEKIEIIVNGFYILTSQSKYWSVKYYKLPKPVTEVRIINKYKGNVIFDQTLIKTDTKNKKLLISIRYPKTLKNFDKIPPKGFKNINIENSKRDFHLENY